MVVEGRSQVVTGGDGRQKSGDNRWLLRTEDRW